MKYKVIDKIINETVVCEDRIEAAMEAERRVVLHNLQNPGKDISVIEGLGEYVINWR